MGSEIKPSKLNKIIPSIEKEKTMKDNLNPLKEDDYVPLNFKVKSLFKKEYRIYAATCGMTMVDILKESFDLYKEKYPKSE